MGDVIEYSTPISPSVASRHGKNHYPAFPESAWEQEPTLIVTDTNGHTNSDFNYQLDKRDLGHLPSLSIHSAVSVDKVLTYKTTNATIFMMPMDKDKQQTTSVRRGNNSMPHVKLKGITIEMIKQEQELKEESENGLSSEDDIPKWVSGGTSSDNYPIGKSETMNGMKSPDADEESMSHMSMDLYTRASSMGNGDVFTPHDPNEVSPKSSPFNNALETVTEEELNNATMKQKLSSHFAMGTASNLSPVQSGLCSDDDMETDNQMIYTEYDDD